MPAFNRFLNKLNSEPNHNLPSTSIRASSPVLSQTQCQKQTCRFYGTAKSDASISFQTSAHFCVPPHPTLQPSAQLPPPQVRSYILPFAIGALPSANYWTSRQLRPLVTPSTCPRPADRWLPVVISLRSAVLFVCPRAKCRKKIQVSLIGSVDRVCVCCVQWKVS